MVKVFTNGCFDIIHPGHLRMLKHCAMMGDHVMVGIDSDRRVKELKGFCRPINSQETRRFILLNFRWVNEVRIFDSDEELTNLVANYQPDYMHAKVLGYFERIDEYSTTKTIQSITSRR